MSKETERAAWGGAFEVFGKMFERLKANPQPWIVYVAAYLVLVLIQLHTIDLHNVNTRDAVQDVGALAGMGGFFYLVFLLALPTYGLALAKGKALSIGEFLRFDARKYFAILVAGLLYALAVVGSALLFIFPAIWVIAWFALFQMAVIDKGLGPVAALKESKRLVQGHKGKVWGIIGATMLLSIGASLLRIIPVVGIALEAVASITVSLLSTAVLASLYRWAK